MDFMADQRDYTKTKTAKCNMNSTSEPHQSGVTDCVLRSAFQSKKTHDHIDNMGASFGNFSIRG